jgi:hypothetical protein
MHEHRWFIEDMLARGWPYEFIAKRVPPDRLGRKVERRSIANHHRRHMGTWPGCHDTTG